MNRRVRVSYKMFRRMGYCRADAFCKAHAMAARLSMVFAIAKAKGEQ